MPNFLPAVNPPTGVNPPNHKGSKPTKSELEAPHHFSYCCSWALGRPYEFKLYDTGVNPPNHSGSKPTKSELEAPHHVSHCCSRALGTATEEEGVNPSNQSCQLPILSHLLSALTSWASFFSQFIHVLLFSLFILLFFYLIWLQLVITTILISLPIMFAFAANYQISKAKSTKMRGRLTNDSITKCSAGLAIFQISLTTPS